MQTCTELFLLPAVCLLLQVLIFAFYQQGEMMLSLRKQIFNVEWAKG